MPLQPRSSDSNVSYELAATFQDLKEMAMLDAGEHTPSPDMPRLARSSTQPAQQRGLGFGFESLEAEMHAFKLETDEEREKKEQSMAAEDKKEGEGSFTVYRDPDEQPTPSIPLPSSPLPTQTPLSTSIPTILSRLSLVSHERATLLTRLQDLHTLEKDLLAQLEAPLIAEQENYQPGNSLGISLSSSYRFSDSSHTIEPQPDYLGERDFASPLDSGAIIDSNNSTGTQIRHRVRTPLSTVPKRVLRSRDVSSRLVGKSTGPGDGIQPLSGAPQERVQGITTGPRMTSERQDRVAKGRAKSEQQTKDMLRTRSEGFGKKVGMELGTKIEVVTKVGTKPEAKTVTKTKTDEGTKTAARKNPETNTKPGTDTKVATNTKSETKTKIETKLEAKPTLKTATKIATKAAPKTKTPVSKTARMPQVTIPTTVARKRWVF